MADVPILTLGLILLIACLVAMISRRLDLPYSVGLVAAGIVLALIPVGVDLPLSRDLIFTVFLPPLVFEAALQLKWRWFSRNLPVTVLLAFPGVLVSAAVVAAGMHYLLGWSWIGAGLFGALIAATDPVSVIATFKQLRVEPRLSLLVESESLLNDGAAAVLFGILVALPEGGAGGAGAIGFEFVKTVAGGIACGLTIAWLLLLIAGRTDDHLIEITLTTLAAYGSFLVAERAGMSGVLASMSAGLLVGNYGWRGAIAESSRNHVLAFWEYAAFLANSVIFILIGGHEAHQPITVLAAPVAVAIVLVLLARAVSVYPLCALVGSGHLAVPPRYQHVLFWGGLRGALALALALALPATVPEQRAIVVVSFAVVAFSIFAQGLTVPWLIRRLGIKTSVEAE